jgi:hypothetical protein
LRHLRDDEKLQDLHLPSHTLGESPDTSFSSKLGHNLRTRVPKCCACLEACQLRNQFRGRADVESAGIAWNKPQLF